MFTIIVHSPIYDIACTDYFIVESDILGHILNIIPLIVRL